MLELSTSLNSVGLLATGGIIAAVVAGWNHVKQWIGYFSSLIITTDHVRGEVIARLTFNHLRRNYRLLPGVQHSFSMMFLEVGKKNNYESIPFKWKTGTYIFVGRFQVYISSFDGTSLKVTSIKGFSKLESIIKEVSLDYVASRASTTTNNYCVRDVMGSEKIGADSYRKNRVSDVDAPEPSLALERFHYEFAYDKDLDIPLILHDQIQVQTNNTNPFDGLFYEDHVWKVVDDINAWFSMKDWYAERSISWRRGVCLHGPGGTGKSAFITAIAKSLGLRLYRYYLATLSDQEFVESWNNMVTPCVVAFEDFDTVFNKRTPLTEHKALTFDCVLNEISGVKTKDGVLLIVTTNHLDCIDPAMGVTSTLGDISTRPGRIDVTCYLGNISKINKVKLANRILVGYPNLIEEALDSSEMTPIQFQELCTQKAYSIMSRLLTKSKESEPI